MNFKFLFFIFCLTGCGVKSIPRVQTDQSVDSYIRKYAGTEEDKKQGQKEEKNKKDSSKKNPETNK